MFFPDENAKRTHTQPRSLLSSVRIRTMVTLLFVREERTSDGMRANPFALVNPIPLPNSAGTPGRQQALATSVSIEGGCPSRGGSAAVEVPSPAVATGAGPVEADPPPTMGEDERRMEGGYVTDVDPDGRLGQHSCYETPAATWIGTHDAARARGCWRSSHDGQLTVL